MGRLFILPVPFTVVRAGKLRVAKFDKLLRLLPELISLNLGRSTEESIAQLLRRAALSILSKSGKLTEVRFGAVSRNPHIERVSNLGKEMAVRLPQEQKSPL